MKETAKAFAKINISLDIISKMPDGYHEMLMIMQTVSLCDEISVECVPGEGFEIKTNLEYIPGDERNIAAKSAGAFFEYTGIRGYRTKINIKKNIPVSAGLGGGSADGACVLRMLNKMFSTNLDIKQLEGIGVRVGADIPFCVSGGTRLARGRGEVLLDIAPLPDCYIVICKPPFSFSTPELFRRIKCEKIRLRPDTEAIIEELEQGSLAGAARRMYNVFEDFLPRGADEIEKVKYSMSDAGAKGAVMTGSGSAVFGIFDDITNAESAYDKLKTQYKDCYLTRPQRKIDY